MRMGLPPVLLSDNGSEFCNALNDQLSEMLGINGLPANLIINYSYVTAEFNYSYFLFLDTVSLAPNNF